MLRYAHLPSFQTLKKLCTIFCIPCIAIVSLWTKIIPVKYNPYVLFSVFVIIAIEVVRSIINKTWPLVETGFHLNVRTGMKYYLFLVSIGVISCAFAHLVVPVRVGLISEKGISVKFLISVIVCTGIQQFLFSLYLVKKMKDIFVNRPIVSCVTVITCFVGAHVFFPNPEVVLPATLLFGLALTPIYYVYPNFLLAWATHCVFNAFAIYVKMFTPIWS